MTRSNDSSFSKAVRLPSRKVMNLKNQLQLYLDIRNITAAELSRKSKVSKQLISQWLSGAEPKNLSHVRACASVLQTTVDHLCWGDGKDAESQRVTELDALIGEGWVSGLFEVRLRRVKRNGGIK